MIKFTIVCLVVSLANCEAGLIPSEIVYKNFPNLKTVYHGHGATSYQNVNIENFGSAPIPKDLQVDDGHDYYNHQQSDYLGHTGDINSHDISSLDHLHNYVNNEVNYESVIVSTEGPYEFNDHAEQLELESQHNYVPPSHYENYDHEIDYEYR